MSRPSTVTPFDRTDDQPEVRAAFRDLGSGRALEGDWQARVWARIAREPERARQRKRLWAWRTAAATLAVLLALVSVRAWQVADESQAIELANKKALADFRAEVEKSERAINELIAEKDAAVRSLLDARSEEEKEAAQRARALAEKKLMAERERLVELRRVEAARRQTRMEYKKRVHVKCDPNDPLCGI